MVFFIQQPGGMVDALGQVREHTLFMQFNFFSSSKEAIPSAMLDMGFVRRLLKNIDNPTVTARLKNPDQQQGH